MLDFASRTAGCPAAERNLLTEPTGEVSPASTPRGAESPIAQPRHPGRAVPLRRQRKVRDDFLGREGRPSQSLIWKAQRQTLYTCLVQPSREVDARVLNESLTPVSRASSAMCRRKNWIIQSPSGVRPLDFRDHIPVRPPPRRAGATRAAARPHAQHHLAALPLLPPDSGHGRDLFHPLRDLAFVEVVH
jgi:hypothetical protein